MDGKPSLKPLWDAAPIQGQWSAGVKGIVFTEFFKHVEEMHGEVALDEIIVRAELPHGGAYTNVGTYPFDEMLALVGAHVAVTGEPVPQMLDGFGQHCFASWVENSGQFFNPERGLFTILSEVNTFHEREVRKLYPDAELPTFTVEARDPRVLVLGYHSTKRLTELAIGVIKGAAQHLGQAISISAETVTGPEGEYGRLRIELVGSSVTDQPVIACPVQTRT